MQRQNIMRWKQQNWEVSNRISQDYAQCKHLHRCNAVTLRPHSGRSSVWAVFQGLVRITTFVWFDSNVLLRAGPSVLKFHIQTLAGSPTEQINSLSGKASHISASFRVLIRLKEVVLVIICLIFLCFYVLTLLFPTTLILFCSWCCYLLELLEHTTDVILVRLQRLKNKRCA